MTIDTMTRFKIAPTARWGFTLAVALTPTSRWGLFFLVFFFCFVSVAHAEHQGPWPRHTIDNSSKGADGVRLADANGDGLQDIVTGWEEAGVVRLYLNPGPEKSKDKWPAVTVGKVNNVEDAVMVDLDNDGAMDVVSSCEGKTKTMYVHWGPKDQAKLLDEKAWTTEAIPATVGKQMWMYCLPIDANRDGQVDLVTGSKGKNAAVGWLELPENPRDLKNWVYRKAFDAEWVMSLELTWDPKFWPPDILVTDRRGEHRGVYIMSFVKIIDHPDWIRISLEVGKSEYMFAASGPSDPWFAVATRDAKIKLVYYDDRIYKANQADAELKHIPNPFGTKHGKAVSMGLIDPDDTPDIVSSFNTQKQPKNPGVAWIKVLPDKDPKDWPAYDISGLEGKKFDRIELIDLDGDGDLDVLTCEEADNLGVIWYENPYGKAEKK